LVRNGEQQQKHHENKCAELKTRFASFNAGKTGVHGEPSGELKDCRCEKLLRKDGLRGETD